MKFTAESVRELVRNNTPEELSSRLTANELRLCFKTLYGIEARPSINKVDLAYKCRDFVSDEIRTADLCKLLPK